MVTYELIKELEKNPLYKIALSKGIISTTVNYNKCIYEHYIEERKKVKSNSQAISNTSEDFKCSTDKVYQVIRYMKE